jgi:hypothetical protein
MDIAEFYAARLDEREAAAKAVRDNSEPWDGQRDAEGNEALRTHNGWVLLPGGGYGYVPGLLPHIALNDPAAVLADIEVKRAILDMWQDPAVVRDLSLHPDAGPARPPQDGRDPDEVEAQVAAAEAIDEVVRILAAPFSAHPDYQERWKP